MCFQPETLMTFKKTTLENTNSDLRFSPSLKEIRISQSNNGSAMYLSDWNDVMSAKKRLFTLYMYQNVHRHFGQSENWILCVSMATRNCNVWRITFSRCCCYFKRYVDTLFDCGTPNIVYIYMLLILNRSMHFWYSYFNDCSK